MIAMTRRGDASTLEFSDSIEGNEVKQSEFDRRHVALTTSDPTSYKELLELAHEKINFDHQRKEQIKSLDQQEKNLREEAN